MAKMVQVISDDIKRLAAGLKQMQFKHAIRESLNNVASLANFYQRQHVDREFTIRNRYTKNSLRMSRAGTTKLEAEVGSIQPYMAKQEEGGTKAGINGGGANVPTHFAAGEPDGNYTRKAVVMRGHRAANLRHVALHISAPRNASGGRKQQIAVAIRILRKTKAKYIYSNQISAKGKVGIYRFNPRSKEEPLPMVHDMTRKVIRIKGTDWHKESIALITRAQYDDIFKRGIEGQLRTAKP